MVRAFSDDAAHVQSKPPSRELSAQLLGCNHILDAIMEFATQQTRGRCLHVNKHFFHFAGKALYRCLRVDSFNINNVFEGALDGEPGFDIKAIKAECKRLMTDKCCLPRKHERRRHHGYFGDSGSDADEVDESGWNMEKVDNAEKEDEEAERHDHDHDHENGDRNEETSPKRPKVEDNSSKCRPSAKPKIKRRKRCPAGKPIQRRTTIRPNSLKAQLLAHVKVLTVASHDHSQCHIFGPYGTDIFPSLDVLRVAPSAPTSQCVDQICNQDWDLYDEPPRVVCPLLAWLNPRKIVFRNVDRKEICAPENFLPNEWPTPRLEEVVFYFCPDEDVYTYNSLQMYGSFASKHFNHAKRIKIVWLQHWEGFNDASTLNGPPWRNPMRFEDLIPSS